MGLVGIVGFPDVQTHVLQSERLDHQDQSFGKGISSNQLGRKFGQQHIEMVSNLVDTCTSTQTIYYTYNYMQNIFCHQHNPCRKPRGISHVSRVFPSQFLNK